MTGRVAVAMSGGVDSAVAAALLVEQGWEVIGITMCFNLAEFPNGNIADGNDGVADARRVAAQLGIRHFVADMHGILEERVIKDFCREYLRGRTPNPCVRCNRYIKFGALFKKARLLGAQYFATGHYARIAKYKDSYFLKKGRDSSKDQSYFLYRLNRDDLRRIIFPLGIYTKERVKELAREFNLPSADKSASQEICFLKGGDYRDFLKARLKSLTPAGAIVDEKGRVLGRHRGIAFYTIGQREGLGVALGYPAYIIGIDSGKNTITLGRKADVLKREFLVKEPHFILRLPKKKVALKVKIRYNHREAAADIWPGEDRVRVCFKKAQFAITPGQSAVFYDKDTVAGGGIIEKVRD